MSTALSKAVLCGKNCRNNPEDCDCQAINFPSSILIICISELTRSLLVFAQNNLKEVRLNIHRCA
jgi:hypothetical protein